MDRLMLKYLLLLTSACLIGLGLAGPISNEGVEENDIVNSNIPYGALFFKVVMKQGRIMMKQNVEINTEEQFIRIDAPAYGITYSPMILVHDFRTKLTLAAFKNKNMCMIMDNYPDIPEDINIWLDFMNEVNSMKYFEGTRLRRYKTHKYAVNQTLLDNDQVLTNPTMLQACPKGMLLRSASMLTMEELSEESDYPIYEEDIVRDIVVLPFYGPEHHGKGVRVKRRAASVHAHQCSVHFQ